MASVQLKELKEKRFILVTGKGGTGKSLTAAAIASSLSAMGKKVILGEITKEANKKSRLHDFFQSSSSEEGVVKNPIEANKYIKIMALDHKQALKEYLELRLGVLAAKVFLKNKFILSFFYTVPGLDELLCLGKIWNILQNTEETDTFILDAPSSGHALSLVQSPERFSKILGAGIGFKESLSMKDFFSDSKKSIVIYTGLPEKMSLEESREYYDLFQKINYKYFLFINKCMLKIKKDLSVDAKSPLYMAWNYYKKRIKNEGLYLAEYESFYPNPFRVPYFFSKNIFPPLREYALHLQEKL